MVICLEGQDYHLRPIIQVAAAQSLLEIMTNNRLPTKLRVVHLIIDKLNVLPDAVCEIPVPTGRS